MLNSPVPGERSSQVFTFSFFFINNTECSDLKKYISQKIIMHPIFLLFQFQIITLFLGKRCTFDVLVTTASYLHAVTN